MESYYFVTTKTGLAPIRVDIVVPDYDPAYGGYAAVPGYMDKARRIFRGEESSSEARQFQVAQGHRLDDLIRGTGHLQYFISGHMESIFRDNGVSGYKAWPSGVFDKDRNRLDYSLLSITGRCGDVDEVEEGVVYFESKWKMIEGPTADVFTPSNTNEILVNERVANMIRKNKLKVDLKPMLLMAE